MFIILESIMSFAIVNRLMDDYKKCLFNPVDDMGKSKRQLMFRNRKHEVNKVALNRNGDKRVVQKDRAWALQSVTRV